MNFQKMIAVLVVGTMTAAVPLFAGPREEYVQQLLQNPPDSPKATLSQSGEIVGFFVVGTSPVPRSMSKAKAKSYARKAARRDAEKKVSQYFNTSVKMAENANGETVLTEVGSSAGDNGAAVSKEESTSINRTSEAFQKVSQAALSGLEGEGEAVNADNEMIVAYSWSVAKCAALKKAIRVSADTADAGVKAANRVEQSRATGATDQAAEQPAAVQPQPVQPAAPANYSNQPVPVQQKVAPAAAAEDFF